jgi:hypothetical protein
VKNKAIIEKRKLQNKTPSFSSSLFILLMKNLISLNLTVTKSKQKLNLRWNSIIKLFYLTYDEVIAYLFFPISFINKLLAQLIYAVNK